jgi:hypothetical protein
MHTGLIFPSLCRGTYLGLCSMLCIPNYMCSPRCMNMLVYRFHDAISCHVTGDLGRPRQKVRIGHIFLCVWALKTHPCSQALERLW